MTYTYALIVDHAEEIVGAACDPTTLAAELIMRSQRFANITLTEATLAECVATGSSIIDLRLRPPQITARVRTPGGRT